MIWPFNYFLKKNKKIRTFTYYIPAPPSRRNGYQEKEFDRIMTDLLEKGYELEDIKLQSHTGQNASGMWILCRLSTDSNKADFTIEDKDHDEVPSTIQQEKFHELSLQKNFATPDSIKEVELPEISEEEAKEQLENLYTIDDHENKV